ncbi:MAG TPA: HAD family hydrolase [Candidatus Limnocylindria bacterium]|nr:HAD family hydrolase [Candidatus Limnocylindria bacterium]
MGVAAGARWVCLDVGETLVDETRVADTWAEVLGVTRLTFSAAFGAVLARGGLHREAFELLGGRDWERHLPEFAEAYGAFRQNDLYPDTLPTLDALRGRGYRLAIVANQPSQRTAELRALGVHADVMAMSDEMGLHKPDPAFFTRALELMGDPDPAEVAYVGDRVDNDVRPSAAAGMRAVWLRRGPWGVIEQSVPPEAVLVVDSLEELVERIESVWAAQVVT